MEMLANSTRERTANQRQGWVGGLGAEQGDQVLWKRAEGESQSVGSKPSRWGKKNKKAREAQGRAFWDQNWEKHKNRGVS